MRLGIVGSEAAKFTIKTEELARKIIRQEIEDATVVISGKCHLGGIDLWAIEEAKRAGKGVLEFPPKILSWEGGYKQRNLQIVQNSDKVICITIKDYPKEYNGMRFKYCYHCQTDSHVKSGGCWTVKRAKMLGKLTNVFIIEE